MHGAPGAWCRGSSSRTMRNALSIDVEDWYHDAAGRGAPATPEEIAPVGSRVTRNVETLFEILDRHDTRATLFFLADVARDHPHLVRRATELGHEVACHGLAHRPVRGRSAQELREDVNHVRVATDEIREMLKRLAAPAGASSRLEAV